jgi:hypothetical protein
MTTVSTQQILDYILEQISKEFNINHPTLVEKYGSVENISNAILPNKNNKKKVVRKVNKAPEPVLEEPKAEAVAEVVAAPVETPKKKVLRKVTKAVEAFVEQPNTEVVETPKKKVVRKVTKAVEAVVEEPKVEVANSTHCVNTEEKVKPAPKRIVKKVSSDIVETKEAPPNKNVESVEVSNIVDNNVGGCDEVEENVYVDTQIYDDEDSDSLEPREINGVKYYIDSSNYVYHIETQDIVGKLNNQGDNIIFLSDF